MWEFHNVTTIPEYRFAFVSVAPFFNKYLSISCRYASQHQKVSAQHKETKQLVNPSHYINLELDLPYFWVHYEASHSVCTVPVRFLGSYVPWTMCPRMISPLLGLGAEHRLNMELDFQSLVVLYVHSCTHWLRPRNPPPPAFGLIYEDAIGQPR
jgi:hypothetical protein